MLAASRGGLAGVKVLRVLRNMATPLQTSLVNFFTPIFIFLLIFVGTYAMLQKTKLLTGNKGLDGIVAFAIGLLFLIYPAGQAILRMTIPWTIILLVATLMIVSFLMFFGVSEGDVAAAMGGATMMIIIISGVVIFFLIAMTNVFGPWLMVDGSATFWGTVKRVLFSSRVLGAIFIVVVASYAVRWLPGK